MLVLAGIVNVNVGATNLTSAANVRSLNVAVKVKPLAFRLPSMFAELRPVMPRSKPSVPFTLNVGTQVAPVAHVMAAFAVTALTDRPLTGFHVADDDMSMVIVVPVALRVNVPVAVPRLRASPPLTVNDGAVAPMLSVRLKSVDELYVNEPLTDRTVASGSVTSTPPVPANFGAVPAVVLPNVKSSDVTLTELFSVIGCLILPDSAYL